MGHAFQGNQHVTAEYRKLSADVDPNVQNAAHLLDKLVRSLAKSSCGKRTLTFDL